MSTAHEAYCGKLDRKGVIIRDGDDAKAILYQGKNVVYTLTGYEYKDDTFYPRPITSHVNDWVFEDKILWSKENEST